MKKVTKYFKYVILIAIICIIGIIIKNISEKNILQMDVAIYKIISENLISDVATPIVKVITNLGGTIFLISLTVFLLLIIKDRKMGLCIAFNLGLSAVINHIFKLIVQRPRPDESFRLIEEYGFSFPSGHSMVSFAFYGFLIYLIYKNVKNKYVKYLSIILLGLLVLLIGTSRIYLGVHYPSDVLTGFLVASLYLIIFISLINRFLLKEKEE